MTRGARTAYTALLLAIGWHAVASAATPSSATLGEVVVTAQKYKENLETTPIAVSSLSGNELKARGYTSVLDLIGNIPDVGVITNTGVAMISIRGITYSNIVPGADPNVATYVDGIYLATKEDVGTAFYDVDRLEVLRGPQGTLFGRNALGGALNIITNRPTAFFNASSDISFGNYNSLNTREMINVPLGKQIQTRLAIATDNHSGYSLNLFNGRYYDDQNAASARLTIAAAPTDALSFLTYLDYHREHDGNYAAHVGGIVNLAFPLQGVLAGGSSTPLGPNGLALNPRLLDDYSIPLNRRISWGISEVATWQINSELTFKSLTGYRHFNGIDATNYQGTTWPFPSDYPDHNYAQFSRAYQASEELQLLAQSSRWNAVAGLFYLYNVLWDSGYTFGLTPDPTPFPFTAAGDIKKPAYAAYAQGTYKVTHRLHATLGLRYSQEANSDNTTWTSMGALLGGFGPCVAFPNQLCHQVAETRYHAVTPRLEFDYQWTDALMTYLSATKGFQSGGFEITSLTPAFAPATVWSYEFGSKLMSNDHRWSANLSAFHEVFTNMQVQEVVAGVDEIRNAATSKIDGVELEIAGRPVAPITIRYAVAYLNPRYTNFTEQNPDYPFLGPPALVANAGHQIQDASKFTSNVFLSYAMPFAGGSLVTSAEANWRSKEYFSEFNDPYEMQPAYWMFNANVRYTAADGRWYVEGYGKNLANSLIVSQTSIGGCGCLNSFYFPPRTYGLTVGYRYR